VDRCKPEELAAEKRAQTLVSYRVGDMVAPALGEREALRAVMGEFAESINQRRRPLTDGHSGLRVLALLEAASESLSRGGIFVDVKQEELV
jgi:predicted dehydrogenase